MNIRTLAAVATPALAIAAATQSVSAQAFCGTCGGQHMLHGENGDLPQPFRIASRWPGTQGDAINLTWGIVGDGTNLGDAQFSGESTAPSSLVAVLDANFGGGPATDDYSSRPWFQYFDQSYTRWSELSGATITYLGADDNSDLPNFGQAGVRADMRIGGRSINNGILAYNYYPSAGDMVINTDFFSGTGAFNNPNNNYRYLRNTLIHEAGHGLGFDHVESNNSGQVMEPFIQTGFDGPQLDDILAVQRNYGDALEKNGGNDTAAASNVTSLGSLLNVGDSSDIGFGGTTNADGFIVRVGGSETDFVSVDDDNDVDFFAFDVVDGAEVEITLTPRGAIYSEGPQGGNQSAFDTTMLGDLVLSLFDTDGTSLLESANDTGLGGTESFIYSFLTGGTYYVGASSLSDNIQLYGLDLEVLTINVIPEPMSLMAGVGLMGLALRRTRRA